MASSYRYEVFSVHALVQQLAANLLPHGYWFYVTGSVPEGKPVEVVDQKLLTKYGIALSRPARARRKIAGFANLHYLRLERFFLIIGTHGRHEFFTEEAKNIRDIRRDPLWIDGYSVTFKKGGFLKKRVDGEPLADPGWHSRVQIARKQLAELKAVFLESAIRSSVDTIASRLFNLDFEPYAPIRQQLLNLLRQINAKRKTAGLDTLPPSVLRYQRRIVKPFEVPTIEKAA